MNRWISADFIGSIAIASACAVLLSCKQGRPKKPALFNDLVKVTCTNFVVLHHYERPGREAVGVYLLRIDADCLQDVINSQGLRSVDPLSPDHKRLIEHIDRRSGLLGLSENATSSLTNLYTEKLDSDTRQFYLASGGTNSLIISEGY